MRGPAMRRMMVASCEVDNIATRRLTRGYARLPPSSLTSTIATTFGTRWLFGCAVSHSFEDFSGLQPVWSAQPVDPLGRSK
jgi:hypothetical protein